MNYYSSEELVDKSACRLYRADLKKCLLDSECCTKLKKTPRECLKNPEGMVPEECFILRNGFFQCKRSLVGMPNPEIDMRTRFRGIKK